MKNLFFLILVVLVSCSPVIDENIAKQNVEELMELIKNHQYEKTKTYYSDSFNESESIEARIKKFKQIESATGPILSYKWIESNKKEIDERNILVLKYKVDCRNTSLTATFLVGLEEGHYKILNHEITNQE